MHVSTPVADKPAPSQMKKAFRKLSIERYQPFAPPKPKADRTGKTTDVITNIYSTVPKDKDKKVYCYNFTVTANDGSGKEMVISKGPRDDASRTERQMICRAALKTVLQKQQLLLKGEAIASDGFTLLYATLDMSEKLKRHSNCLRCSVADLPSDVRRYIRLEVAREIVIEIQPNQEQPCFSICAVVDYMRSGAGLAKKDNTMSQFLNIVTSEPAISQGYAAFGRGNLFPKNEKGVPFSRGCQVRIPGLEKTVCTVETAPGLYTPALAIDLKTGVFFDSLPLLDLVRDFCCRRQSQDREVFDFAAPMFKAVNEYVKGIRVTIPDEKVSFMIAGLSEGPASKIGLSGKYDSRFGHWPAAMSNYNMKGEREKTFYPLEKCVVSKNQLVPKEKQEKAPAPIGVQQRFEQLQEEVSKIYCQAKSELDAFGFSLLPKPEHVKSFTRPHPQPLYAKKTAGIVDPKTGDWKLRGCRFHEIGKMDQFIIGYDCSQETAKKLLEALSAASRKHGINAPWRLFSVEDFEETREKIKNLFEHVKEAKSRKAYGSPLVVYLDSFENKKSHNILKLLERNYVLSCQHVNTETISKTERIHWIADDILAKANVKLGGINYVVEPEPQIKSQWISNGKTLVISYDVSHPTGSRRETDRDGKPLDTASVVGMSFNGARNPESFIGDFAYQAPCQEEVDSDLLADRVNWMLTKFKENRKNPPEMIIIFRDGVSEGQYAMVVDKEFAAIKKGVALFRMAQGAGNWTPKFLLCVATKRHNRRFFKETSPGRVENTPAGTIVDDKVVRPDMTHFYLQSHHGTGKFTSYTVLVDETNLSQDQLQSFANSLCFEHQIVQGAISLPEPIYQADEYATRGQNMWTTYLSQGYPLQRESNYDESKFSSAPIDYKEMTKRLGYKGCALENFRINA